MSSSPNGELKRRWSEGAIDRSGRLSDRSARPVGNLFERVGVRHVQFGLHIGDVGVQRFAALARLGAIEQNLRIGETIRLRFSRPPRPKRRRDGDDLADRLGLVGHRRSPLAGINPRGRYNHARAASNSARAESIRARIDVGRIASLSAGHARTTKARWAAYRRFAGSVRAPLTPAAKPGPIPGPNLARSSPARTSISRAPSTPRASESSSSRRDRSVGSPPS